MAGPRLKSPSLDDYRALIGEKAVDRIRGKAARLAGHHVAHINSTFYGGGVATLLSSLTLLMNDAGLKTGWRVIQGAPDFFGVTKKMHNALQGGSMRLTRLKKDVYESIVAQNALRNHLDDHDLVVVHDPQPLPMIRHYRRRGPWIWRCHIDLTKPHPGLWRYLKGFVEDYDAAILSMRGYRRPDLKTPQRFFMPAIDPFSIVNEDMTEAEADERLAHYNIPTDLPLVVQVSRFDHWKDPKGVIEAFKLARREKDCTLVLLGNVATDDPEGPAIYESLLEEKEDRIIILSVEDTALVNALQRRAAVVLQKSLREGFGLTVAEAMWKGTPVIGGNAGGIRAQIDDGENGFLVDSVPQAADRIVRLLSSARLRRRMGEAARRTVREKFLMTRLLEQYLGLFDSFRTTFRLKA
jgi:trehalose synthase